METTLLDMAGTLVAIVLTLFVFSYLLGDNVLYRLAEYIFVGVTVGYAVVVAFHNILAPKLITPLIDALSSGDWGRLLLILIALIFGLLLLTKPFRSLSWLGNLSVAFLLGVGAHVAFFAICTKAFIPQCRIRLGLL